MDLFIFQSKHQILSFFSSLHDFEYCRAFVVSDLICSLNLLIYHVFKFHDLLPAILPVIKHKMSVVQECFFIACTQFSVSRNSSAVYVSRTVDVRASFTNNMVTLRESGLRAEK